MAALYFCKILLLIALVCEQMLHSGCQDYGYENSGPPTCIDFESPTILQTDGTRAGQIVYPLMGNRYKNNQLCEWVIMTDRAGYVIKLQVSNCNLEDKDIYGECSMDYVDIFDWKNGQPVFQNRFCGTESGMVYESSSQKITLKFHSSATLTFSGFNVRYQSVEAAGDMDSKTVLLAICIPVAVIVLAMCIPFVWGMVRIYQRKTAPPTRVTSNNPPPYSITNQDPASLNNLPVRVMVPAHISRCSAPPPPYDSLHYETIHLDMPVNPPPYELIVKDNNGHIHSSSET